MQLEEKLKCMNEAYWSVARIAGLLLLASALIPIGGVLLIVAATDYRPVIGGSLQDLERIAGQIKAHRWALTFWVGGYLGAVSGYGLLTTQVQQSVSHAIASIALIGVALAFIFVALEASFHMSMTTWVAEKTVHGSDIQSFYEPLRLWTSVYGQRIYVFIGLLAIAGYGWAFLRTDLLPDLVGWASIGWGVLWIAALLVFQITIPGTLLIMSSLIGMALLL